MMFPLPYLTDDLSNFPLMLHQPYEGRNLDLLIGKALSCFYVTMKCFRRSTGKAFSDSDSTGRGTSVQRTVSAPCVTPSTAIYMHVHHCCSCVAEPFFHDNQSQLQIGLLRPPWL